MGLFDYFRRTAKQTQEAADAERARREDLEVYSGMRVEVTSDDGRMFLVARLQGLRGDRAQLKPSTEGSLMTPSEAPVPVALRGYSSKENRAVTLHGIVRMTAGGVWQMEQLALVKREDSRVHIRMEVQAEGTVRMTGNTAEEPCTLLNISLGGACIGQKSRHNVGDKLVLRTRLFPEGELLVLRCQILRILERRHDYFEYGCRFLDLEPADEERILRSAFKGQTEA